MSKQLALLVFCNFFLFYFPLKLATKHPTNHASCPNKAGDRGSRTRELLVAFEPSDGGGWSAGHGGAVQLDLLSFNGDFFLDVNDQVAWRDYKEQNNMTCT